MVRKLAIVVAVVFGLVAFQNCGGHLASNTGSSSVDSSSQAAADAGSAGGGAADAGGAPNDPVVNPPVTVTQNPPAPPAVFVIPTTAIADVAVLTLTNNGTNYTCPAGMTGPSINSVYGWGINQEFCERPYASTDTQILKDVKFQSDNATCPAGYANKGTVIYSPVDGAAARKNTLCVQYQPVASATRAIVRLRSTTFAAVWAANAPTAVCQTGEVEIGRRKQGALEWPVCMSGRGIGLPDQVLTGLVFGSLRKCPAGSEIAVELLAYGGMGGNDICATMAAPAATTQVIVDLKIIDKDAACAAGYDPLPFVHPLLPNEGQIACVKKMAASAATQAVTRIYWRVTDTCQPGHLKAGGIKHPIFNGGSTPTGFARYDACIAY